MRNHRPSATAHVIAASTVFLSHDPRYAPLIPDLAVEASIWFMQACSRVSPRLIGLMQRHWFRAAVAAWEHATVPGIMLHYLLRKCWLENHVRTRIAAGTDQIVILGGGFDTLALRLHREFPNVHFVEVDHPATQQAKRMALEGRSLLGTNISFVAADLTQENWEKGLLSQSEFRHQADTLIIAEAVLMYIEPKHIDAIFQFLRQHTNQRSRFLFTFMESRPNGTTSFHNATWLLNIWLKWRGEPFTWGIRRDALGSFLRDRDFALRELTTSESLHSRHCNAESTSPPIAVGELMCVAERVGLQSDFLESECAP